MHDDNHTMHRESAAEEALCSLYRLEATMRDRTPMDAVAALGALEHLVLSDPSAKARMTAFRAALNGVSHE